MDTKEDGSPVTAADRACDAWIRTSLAAVSVHPILTEETYEPAESFPTTFWLVDPLDGTKEFIRSSGEFTVNIALVSFGRPLLGVVYAPVLDLLYFAAEGEGAFRRSHGLVESIAVAPAAVPLRVAVSRDHIGAQETALISRLGSSATPMGSSLKFCLVAEGATDLYPRYGRTREWDTAAAQCVVEQAGGRVIAEGSREPLRYAKPDLVNPSFMAIGDERILDLIL